MCVNIMAKHYQNIETFTLLHYNNMRTCNEMNFCNLFVLYRIGSLSIRKNEREKQIICERNWGFCAIVVQNNHISALN